MNENNNEFVPFFDSLLFNEALENFRKEKIDRNLVKTDREWWRVLKNAV